MFLAEYFYNKSPIFVQNAMVSAYGLKLYYERYLGNYKKYLNELLETERMSKSEIERYQNERFMNLVNYAYKYVPYYKDLLNDHGLHPNQIKSIEDLKKIPILEKETIRTESERLVSNEICSEKIISLNTSGTTGKSLKVFMDLDARRKEYAFIARSQLWAGLKNGKNGITFGGRAIVPNDSKKKIFWRFNAFMNNYIFSSYHLSEANIPYYVEKMKEVQPSFIDSYPSSIYAIASFMDENSIKGIYPKAILTTAETLTDYQRETIEKVFECSVYDQYGCTEQAVFISQCSKGSYHIHPEYGIVEILNDNGEEVKQEEIGKTVCTGFTNKTMPLIRYNVGDTLMKSERLCGCGLDFSIVEKIYGRQDDFILTPDGRKVGRLDPIFKGLVSIKGSQIIQTSLDRVEIRLIPGNTYKNEDGQRLTKELKNRLGELINIDIVLVEHIPKTKSGKTKAVISMILK